MLFEELISRAAEPTLQGLVGRPVVRLLSKLDSSLLQPSRLSEIALALKAPEEIILDPISRAELVQLLRPHEAAELASILGLDTSSPYQSLKAAKIRRRSSKAEKMLDYFTLADREISVSENEPTIQTVQPMYGLFDHQRVAAVETLRCLEVEPNRALLHMPTGSGKTRTAMYIIAEWLRANEPCLIVWLAHSEELCGQAVQEFQTAWRTLGNRDLEVGRWWGGHTIDLEELNDGLLVIGLAKIYSSARSSTKQIGQIAGSVGLIVMDEAHQAVAPTYQMVLDLLANSGTPTPLLGLSATPGRTWNDIDEDERLADFFHRRRVRLDIPGFSSPIEYLVNQGYLASAKFRSLNYNSGVEISDDDLKEIARGFDLPSRVVKRLAEDDQRNLLIINRAEIMSRTHRRMIIFAATVEHAKLIATVLHVRGIWARSVTGDTPGVDRRGIIDGFKDQGEDPRILVNFGVLTTGFDAPMTSAAIIARPTKSLVLYSQMVGRAIRGRLAGGNDNAEIVTVVDTQLPGFTSIVDSFDNWEDVW